MPKFDTTIPTQEEMKDLWVNLMFASDAVLTAWAAGDQSLPVYIRRYSDTDLAHQAMAYSTLRYSLEDVLRVFPDRDFAPALKLLVEILGSEERMTKLTSEQKSALFR